MKNVQWHPLAALLRQGPADLPVLALVIKVEVVLVLGPDQGVGPVLLEVVTNLRTGLSVDDFGTDL